MARPPVDTRLQKIENGIGEIMEKLCEMNPCSPKKPNNQTEESEEE